MKCVLLVLAFVSSAFGATTVELLSGDPQFSTLVNLTVTAGLVDTLNNGNFTIFAPTNAAFNKLPASTINFLRSNVTALTDVLTYHVVSGNIKSDMATDELLVSTVNGANARFNIYPHNSVVTIQGSTISEFDREASNGVIHVIDSVMMAPTGDIVDIASSNSDFSTLVSLVVTAGLVDDLKKDGLTVFAPTNAAFDKLPQHTLDQIKTDKQLLINILTYHVVPSTEYSVGLYKQEHLQPLYNGDDLAVHFTHHNTDVKINNALVISADIDATNGVIHAVDHVLVPHGGLPVGR